MGSFFPNRLIVNMASFISSSSLDAGVVEVPYSLDGRKKKRAEPCLYICYLKHDLNVGFSPAKQCITDYATCCLKTSKNVDFSSPKVPV